MNKSQKIHLDIDNLNADKHVKVKLEQDINTLEFLTMSIDTKDVYRDFNADYGVLVGRVIANGGIGIPNARISIFIPLTDEDAARGEVYSIYPYKTPRDKNLEGKRYNLLPRVSKINPSTGFATPKQAFGSFPIKEEITINEPFLNVYKKYYKYTALTNNSGDYMIFGVPVGTQTVHLSVDITDIGKYSMTPAAMVTNLGYSPNLFTDGNSKIKPSTDLNDLPHIETQEISVDIIPFWGDTTNFEIGITRQDFRIRSVLQNTFVIFGSVFTDGVGSMYGKDFAEGIEMRELYRISEVANENIGIKSKRVGKITEKVYYYPASVSDFDIDNDNVNPITDMILMSPTEYSVYKRDGDFVFIISCNRNKIITDEFGNETPVDENASSGVFTKFRGFITLEYTVDDIPMDWIGWLDDDNNKRAQVKPIRHKLKFPQHADKAHSFRNEVDDASANDTDAWRKQHYTFSGGNYYSVAHFHGVVHNNTSGEGDQSDTSNPGFLGGDTINLAYNIDQFWNTGVIATNDYGINTGNTRYEMINNSSNGELELFAGNWLNLSVHLMQNGNLISHRGNIHNLRINSNNTQNYRSDFYMNDNIQKIAGGDFNTKWFARSDLHWTDFIHVPKTDILAMNNYAGKGFKKSVFGTTGLTGTYRNGLTPCPYNGGKLYAKESEGQDPETYFFKGFDTADCIQYLVLLGLI